MGGDGLAALIGRLTYSKEDERSGKRPKHRIEIVGDVYNGTVTLKNAVVLYREFRSSEGGTSGSRKALEKQRPQARRTRRAGGGWPVWPRPNDEDLLGLARAMAPFVRFLDPDVIYTVVEDNRRMGADWSARLEAFGIDPAIYL